MAPLYQKIIPLNSPTLSNKDYRSLSPKLDTSTNFFFFQNQTNTSMNTTQNHMISQVSNPHMNVSNEEKITHYKHKKSISYRNYVGETISSPISPFLKEITTSMHSNLTRLNFSSNHQIQINNIEDVTPIHKPPSQRTQQSHPSNLNRKQSTMMKDCYLFRKKPSREVLLDRYSKISKEYKLSTVQNNPSNRDPSHRFIDVTGNRLYTRNQFTFKTPPPAYNN